MIDDVPYPEFVDELVNPGGRWWRIAYTISGHVDQGPLDDLDDLLEHWQALSTTLVGESLVLYDGTTGAALQAWVGTDEVISYSYPT